MARVPWRRVLIGGVAAAALCGGVAAAASSPGANLNGSFRVTERVTATDGIINAHNGQRYAYVWRAVPDCTYGACPATLRSSSGLVLRMRPTAGGGYVGSGGIPSVDCVSRTYPYALLTHGGYSETVTANLTPTDVVRGAAHGLAGTLRYVYVPSARGRALDCTLSTQVRQLRGVAEAGTVRPAVAPTHHHPTTPTANGPRAEVSTLASSLVPIQDAFPLGVHLLLDALFALLAMLLITFPAQVFNRTLDEHYEDLKDLVAARAPALVAIARGMRRAVTASPPLSFLVVLLVGTVTACCNDPGFGWGVESARTFTSVLLAFLVAIGVAAAVGWGYRRARGLDVSASLHAIPAGLVVAVVCVVVSRLSHFEPGYLYGVVAGVAYTTKMGHREKGHEVALASLATMLVALGAWIAWSAYERSWSRPHQGFGVLLVDTLLASLFVSGVVNTVINLVPLDALAGGALFKWHKGAWAATFSSATFLLATVMLSPASASARTSKSPVVTTVVLFVVFGAISISFNRYMAHRSASSAATAATPATSPVTGSASTASSTVSASSATATASTVAAAPPGSTHAPAEPGTPPGTVGESLREGSEPG